MQNQIKSSNRNWRAKKKLFSKTKKVKQLHSEIQQLHCEIPKMYTSAAGFRTLVNQINF